MRVGVSDGVVFSLAGFFEIFLSANFEHYLHIELRGQSD